MFVVLEGLDRAGKSTQLQLLESYLSSQHIPFESFKYPDRKGTVTGPLIDDFLKGNTCINWNAASFLLASNLYELVPRIHNAINSGKWVLFDRYAPSSVAYSIARGLDASVAHLMTSTLPIPDRTFYLQLSPEAAASRADYGSEIFEREGFQKKVAEAFQSMPKPSGWVPICTDNISMQEIHNIIIEHCKI